MVIMAASYPGEYRRWTTKRDYSQTIIESHMNDIQTEAVAGQRIFGTNPQIATNDPGGITRDYGTVRDRIQRMIRGEHLPYVQASVKGYQLHTVSQEGNPEVPDKDPDDRDLDWCGPGKRQRAKILTCQDGSRLYMPYHWEVMDKDGYGVPWLGVPLRQDEETIADGGWQRLPFMADDDPFGLHIGDAVRLNETGFWIISLMVHHASDDNSRAVRARRRARLEIDGRDVTLRHMVRDSDASAEFLTNRITWMDNLKKGTVISASARVDGTDLEDSYACNAYLRVQLLRCTGEDDDGKLRDFPESIYTPPPPPPKPKPVIPNTPSTSSPSPSVPPTIFQPSSGYQSSGPYAIEAHPGEWYGIYGWGTVGPSHDPIFPGIGLIEAVYN